MLVTTEGIVLHYIKYGETSVIATIFTRESGRQSFIINAARGKKSKNKINLLQPLFIIDLVAYQKQTREIQRIKEIKSNHVYQSIPFEIQKSSQVFFLAEILYKTITGQESYLELYDFIKNGLLYFDLLEKGIANFHLYFLYRLSGYLGFLPDTKTRNFEGWWDLRKGALVPFEPSHPLYANKDITKYLVELSGLKFQDLSEFNIPKKTRSELVSKFMDYYQLHFENLGQIKSLKVLKELFL
jgi:DNA repair protein RecO (recombination protein O)